MDPQKIANEYLSAIGTGIRFIITLIISAFIAETITRSLETDNFFAYALILFCVVIAIYAAIDFCLKNESQEKPNPHSEGVMTDS
ncbi:Uncharacterised protein [Ectopseudomonas mendocina]|uniref:Uncharacterized protein n=1 Tax=Ectopseudomonas mendocina TaxID=300 RepID=A0A379IPW5_ECTME|nr:Uncharacterised protein [Pseudomonas mendocina]